MKKVSLLSLILVSSFSYAEETITQTIGAINFNAEINVAFFRGNLKWGAPNCPNATYIQINSSLAGRKELISIALAAKMANKPVRFWGTCNENTDYFDAMYIVVE